MIKILQFGEGNFLRSFADAYFDTLNEEGGDYGVYVAQPIPSPIIEKFVVQSNVYHIVLRGMENGKPVENVRKIDALKDVFSPMDDMQKFMTLARDPEVRLVVSNTTEAGICYSDGDTFDGFSENTFPAKLTRWLYERYLAGLDGVYLLPVELIENNADALKACVDKYIAKWSLPEGFRMWNNERNYYCNTLVDRIVSGYPREEATLVHLQELIGCRDELVSVGEPFGLWAIEKKGGIEELIREGKHNIEVILTNDIDYYKKRKVRVLNGSHTNLVPAGIILGKETVYDCMTDARLSAFVDRTLREEIIPFVSADVSATTAFAEDVKERFLNPYLNHRLTSIALNSISKWRARDLPSLRDYYAKHKKIPRNLTVGFSYLIKLYYDRHDTLQDEREFLDIFASHAPVEEILRNVKMWGEDLGAYDGFVKAVKENLQRIDSGEMLI